MEATASQEVRSREKFSLEGSILAYGFLSNRQTLNEYVQERENLRKVLSAGVINSPNARTEKSDYDLARYSVGGDLPIDATRVCFYLWKENDAPGNDMDYSREAVWVAPMTTLEGLKAHADPGASGSDAIGVTSPDGKVEIPLESGKLLISFDMFIDIFPDVLARSKKLGVSLNQYMTENVYLLTNEEKVDVAQLTEVAFSNVTPAEGVTAQIDHIKVSMTEIEPTNTLPYTKDELGNSEKLNNNNWIEVIDSFVDDAQKATYYNDRTLHELKVVEELAREIDRDDLASKAIKAYEFIESQPSPSI